MDYTSAYTDDDAIITWIKEFSNTLEHHDFNEPYNAAINPDAPSVVNTYGVTSGDPVSLPSAERLDHDDIKALRCVIAWCVESLIVSGLEGACYGCLVNHPSQRHHTCLYEPDAYHFDRCYDDICVELFKPSLPGALCHALVLLRRKTVSAHRVMGAAEAIVSEWRSEPYIIEKLKEIRESVLRYNSQPIVVQCVQMWRNAVL